MECDGRAWGDFAVENSNNAQYGRHVAQVSSEVSFCAGCRSCEVICAIVRDGVTGPARQRLFVRRDIRLMTHEVQTCKQCINHPCYNACPKKDEAMVIGEDSIVYIDEQLCIGCGLCMRACPFERSRINYFKEAPKEQRKARKCDLCRGRKEGPACVQWCPVCCLEVR